MEIKTIEWKKIFARYTASTELIPRIYKEQTNKQIKHSQENKRPI